MITLGVETSCDETAIAVAKNGRILSSGVSSSVHLHASYGGVVPEIASRFHTEYIYSVFEKAIRDAGCVISDIDLIAVTNGPGLPGSLLVGIAFAKALSFANKIPLIGVNHLKAHMFSSFLDKEIKGGVEGLFPFIGVIVSGGHTAIYLCESFTKYSIMGRTRDDAAGEAFDKVSKILGLGYPGGPIVEEKALEFSGEKCIKFPRALMEDAENMDFSFSGIKTAVLYYCRDKGFSDISNVCFSFQEAVIEVIEEKIVRAVKASGIKKVAIGGGVINNNMLRKRIYDRCHKEKIDLYIPEKRFCADNGAMIAFFGEKLFAMGMKSDLSLKVVPEEY